MLGALTGVSLVTLKANVLDSYAEGSVREALGELLPWVIGGAAIGAISISTGEGATIGHAVGPTVQGAVAGVATGAAVGALMSLGPEDLGDELPGGVGSGALIGLGAGALVSAIEVWAGPGEEHNGWGPGAWGGGIAAIPLYLLVGQVLMPMGRRRGTLATAAVLGSVFAAVGCGLNEFVTTCPPPSQGMGAPLECRDLGGSDQEAVLFLVGDAGYVPFVENPVLHDLQERVRALSDRGVPVMVLYLGDNVYDAGVRADHTEDLELLDAQVEVVRGASARARFIPGNHDWANTTGPGRKTAAPGAGEGS